VGPNPSFERTCTGVPRLALISFWAKRLPPAPAAQLKLYAAFDSARRILCDGRYGQKPALAVTAD